MAQSIDARASTRVGRTVIAAAAAGLSGLAISIVVAAAGAEPAANLPAIDSDHLNAQGKVGPSSVGCQ
jgi:hypothetical protein